MSVGQQNNYFEHSNILATFTVFLKNNTSLSLLKDIIGITS